MKTFVFQADRYFERNESITEDSQNSDCDFRYGKHYSEFVNKLQKCSLFKSI